MDLDCKELERLKELVPYKILAPTPNEIINYIEQLQFNWNSLKEDLEWVINDYNGDIDIETRNIDSEFLRGMSWEAQELLDKMNGLESGGKD